MNTPAEFFSNLLSPTAQTRDGTRAAAWPAARPADAAIDAPRLVIRGESLSDNSGAQPESLAVAALTDWLNVTFRWPDEADTKLFFERFSESTDGVFGGMTDRRCGLHGWTHSFCFDRGTVMFARGGQRGTALLSMPGEGCSFVQNWAALQRLLRDEFAGRITRWDGAADDYEGQHSVDMAVELYKLGGFKCGGREPTPAMHGNWLTPDARGRTFEVGARRNGKLARISRGSRKAWCVGMLTLHRRTWHLTRKSLQVCSARSRHSRASLR